MRTIQPLLAITLTALLAEVVSGQQPAPKPAPRTTPPAAHVNPPAAQARFKPVATIMDLMGGMIDPASKVVFNSVGTEVVNGAETEKKPKNDEEWEAVRRAALMMTEGANLIMMEGRHAARPGHKVNDGELPHAQIEALMNKDRASWNKLAQEFRAAAEVTLKAAEAKDATALFESGGGIDTGCENCHLKFWYPDQDKLFQK